MFARKPRTALEDRLNLISAFEPVTTEPHLNVEQDWRSSESLLAELSFDNHLIEIAGFPSPLPAQAAERTILASNWAADVKELMNSHLLHVVLQYGGHHPDPIEQYIALYKVAALFDEEDLLGVANEPAWTAHPREMIQNILDPELLKVCRQSPPLIYWTGFVKAMLGEEERWTFTRGNHLFNVPDFAWLLEYGADPLHAHDVFHELFHYCYYENSDVQPGDAIQVDNDVYYAFYEADGPYETLKGEGRLLIVTPVSEAELNAMEPFDVEDR